jgi:hypothetical protein
MKTKDLPLPLTETAGKSALGFKAPAATEPAPRAAAVKTEVRMMKIHVF